MDRRRKVESAGMKQVRGRSFHAVPGIVSEYYSFMQHIKQTFRNTTFPQIAVTLNTVQMGSADIKTLTINPCEYLKAKRQYPNIRVLAFCVAGSGYGSSAH